MEKICYMLFNLPRNWDIIPFTLFSTLAVDLTDYNLPVAWSNYKMPRFSLYGGTPPKLASASDNGGSRPRIIPHTELASSVRHRMLPLYHFLSLSLYFYLSLYLTIWEADLNLFHPQRWPHQSETGRWQIQGQGLMYLKKCGKKKSKLLIICPSSQNLNYSLSLGRKSSGNFEKEQIMKLDHFPFSSLKLFKLNICAFWARQSEKR